MKTIVLALLIAVGISQADNFRLPPPIINIVDREPMRAEIFVPNYPTTEGGPGTSISIHYTLDGSHPTLQSPIYVPDLGLMIPDGVKTIRAFGHHRDLEMKDSHVCTYRLK